MTYFQYYVHIGNYIFERLITHIEEIGNIDTQADRMNYSSSPKLFDLDSIVICYAQKYPGFRANETDKKYNVMSPYIFTKLRMACEYKYCTRFRCKAEIVCVVRNIRSPFLSLSHSAKIFIIYRF